MKNLSHALYIEGGCLNMATQWEGSPSSFPPYIAHFFWLDGLPRLAPARLKRFKTWK